MKDDLGIWIAGAVAAGVGILALVFGSQNMPNLGGPPSSNGGDYVVPKKKGCGCSLDNQ